MKKWYRIEALAEREADILIYEQIGKDYWSETGIGAKEFVEELNALDVDKITLRINSPGGNVFEGHVIYNALRANKARIDVHIDGIAASIASEIAMAGDTVHIPENAMIMIHDPACGEWGTAVDMRKTADTLDKLKVGIIASYRQKTGLDETVLGEMMAEETWMTAAEAVEHGFADTITDPVMAQANFEQLKNFRNTPERLFLNRAAIPEQQPSGGTDMADKTEKNEITLDFIRAHHPTIAQAFIDEGATGERERIKGVMALARDNMTDDIQAMVFDGKSSAGDVAVAILQAGPVPPAAPQLTAAQAAAADLAADGAEIPIINSMTPDNVQDETEMQSFMDNIKAGAAQHK
ncbi:MAG: Clp protease ClpP [Proteobacteria bacterium]|nr:Clp protease ClpP [Pseudomonadota bacterium]